MTRQELIETIDREYQPCHPRQRLYHLPLWLDEDGRILFMQGNGTYSGLPVNRDSIPEWAIEAEESGFGKVCDEYIGSKTNGAWRKVFRVFPNVENISFKQFLSRNWWQNVST